MIHGILTEDGKMVEKIPTEDGYMYKVDKVTVRIIRPKITLEENARRLKDIEDCLASMFPGHTFTIGYKNKE